ncbi:MAG: hypothetical protein QXQ97_06715 [Saccharolobus sp.]
MESIGELISNKEIAKIIIQLLTMDIWHRTDRDVNFFQLGVGIGRSINKIDKEALKFLVESCEYYQSLCKGIARGMSDIEVSKDLLIYIADLSPIMAREILANLEFEKYPDIVKALAYKVSSLKYLPGVGSNIARQIDKIPFEIRRQVINIFKDNVMFLYEFIHTVNLNKVDDLEQFIGKSREIDEIIGYKLDEVNDKLKEKLLNFPNISSGIAKGFQKLPYYWKRRIIEKAKIDIEFAKGFISAIDLSSLEEEFINKVIELGKKNDELSRALGRNFGDSLPNLTEDLKIIAYRMAEENTSFAYGLGEGISESLGSFIGFIKGKIYELRKEDQERILDLAFKSNHFAKGLLSNFNALFFFDNKERVLLLVMKHKEHLPTFIEQISRRINEFDLSKLLPLNENIGKELGKILCRNFVYLNKQNKELVLQWLSANPDLREGFLEC